MLPKEMCASCRCVIQLTVVGYILAPIFSLDAWWLVILYAFVVMGVASLEAVSRPAASYKASPSEKLAKPSVVSQASIVLPAPCTLILCSSSSLWHGWHVGVWLSFALLHSAALQWTCMPLSSSVPLAGLWPQRCMTLQETSLSRLTLL